MGKILVVTEKPSVAQDIAKILKCSYKGTGYVYNDTYIISWAIGHLVRLCTPDEYDAKYKKWSFDNLPIIPREFKLKPIEPTISQFNILKKLIQSKDIDYVICATDSGREGELIFRNFYYFVECDKPFKRLWISSMTDEAIKEGFNNLQDGSCYDNLYLSAKSREEADWIVGINSSRAYTSKYSTTLSIGRVQTPTLAIIVERQKEINAFVPQNYWEVDADFEKYVGTWFNRETKDTKIDTEELAKGIAEKVLNQKGTITCVKTEEKRQLHSLLYDLTELQRDCNRNFGFSAQKTLDIAQKLYERRKLITYPRTDSRYISEDIKPKIKTILNKINIEPYKNHLAYVISLKQLPFTKRIVDNTKISDHHAIIPTSISVNLNNLSSDEFKVYDLIIRRFICVFYFPYIYLVTNVITEVDNKNFISKGVAIKQLDWMELYNSENKEKELPSLNEGEIYTVISSNVIAKKTQPPKAYTEATLLSAMENAGKLINSEEIKEQMKDSGLGTAATRAAIINRLFEVGYIVRKGKSLIPTEKGTKLIEVVPPELKTPETTGKWEKYLNLIARGSKEPELFMRSIQKYVRFIIREAKEQNSEIIFPEDTYRGKINKTENYITKCPICNKGYIMENNASFYCSRWKQDCKFTIWKIMFTRKGINPEKTLIKKLIENKKCENVIRHSIQDNQEHICNLVLNINEGTIDIIDLG